MCFVTRQILLLSAACILGDACKPCCYCHLERNPAGHRKLFASDNRILAAGLSELVLIGAVDTYGCDFVLSLLNTWTAKTAQPISQDGLLPSCPAEALSLRSAEEGDRVTVVDANNGRLKKARMRRGGETS
ncbi:hypothetical protein BJY01DRAFT_223354 [Aspergillus pseudoustus]|uniref:Uncharacterized protein n=1 Tax=Aspergillus pseudoustus TaxID=1810923 RepID=A0ABR4J6F8_9EURO